MTDVYGRVIPSLDGSADGEMEEGEDGPDPVVKVYCVHSATVCSQTRSRRLPFGVRF